MALMVSAENPNFYYAELIPPVTSQPNNVEQEQDVCVEFGENVEWFEKMLFGTE